MSICRQRLIAGAVFFACVLALSAPAAAQVSDWMKPYVGGQIGYSWDNIDMPSNPPGPFSGFKDFEGVIGGIQGGKNFIQRGSIIAGLVADFNWLDASTHSSASQSFTSFVDICGDGCIVETTTDIQSEVGLDLEWKASIRGKAGILVAPNVLVYVTAGVAFARLEAQASQSITVTTTQLPTARTTTSGSDSAILKGYVVGVGTEVLVAPNIGAFGQVLYYGFEPQSLSLLGSTVDVELHETVAVVGVSFYLN